MQPTTKEITNREVKASAFTTLFGKAENAAQLYAALNGEETVSPEEIEFTTLQGVLFMLRKNDLAFVAGKRVLVISEHQSTINNNMPLRDVIYYGRTIEKLVEPRALYKTKMIGIPTPEFLVFYNGDHNFPPEKTLKLSDAFLEKTEEPMLELTVKIININLPIRHPVLERCRPLYEYSWFIQHIKTHMLGEHSRDEAIIAAIADCRKEGILEEFLREHGSEVVNMLFTEFNMDDALEVRGEEKYAEGLEKGLEKGIAKGKATDILELLEDLGPIPPDLKGIILSQQNPSILTQWLRLAAKAESMAGFESQIH